MKKGKISIAICDKNKLFKELLHHVIERSGYEVLYSATDFGELSSYFVKQPFDILLINAQDICNTVLQCLKELHALSKTSVSIVFFNCNKEPKLTADIKKKFEDRIYFCGGGMHILFDTLDHALTCYQINKPKEITYQAILLLPQHPFYKISCNRVYVDIIRMIADGKSHFQIAKALNLSVNTVNTYIRNIREETNCNNIPHLVAKAKECHIA